jgi:hypothetical protein
MSEAEKHVARENLVKEIDDYKLNNSAKESQITNIEN